MQIHKYFELLSPSNVLQGNEKLASGDQHDNVYYAGCMSRKQGDGQ